LLRSSICLVLMKPGTPTLLTAAKTAGVGTATRHLFLCATPKKPKAPDALDEAARMPPEPSCSDKYHIDKYLI